MALTAIVLTSLNLRAAITALAPLISEIQDDLMVGASLFGVLGMIPTAMFATAAFALPSLKIKFTTSQLLLAAMLLSAIGQAIRVLGGPSTLVAGSVVALFSIGITKALMPPGSTGILPQPGGCDVHDLPDHLTGDTGAGPDPGGADLRLGPPHRHEWLAGIPGCLGTAGDHCGHHLVPPADSPGGTR